MKKKVCKRTAALIVVFMLLVSVCPLSVYAEDSPIMPGDVNGDGKVAADDARLALRGAIMLDILDADETQAADVDGASGVTAADARLILRAAVNLETLGYTLPYDEETVLAAYSRVMNGFKNSPSPFTKKEYQEIPEKNKNLGLLGNTILSIAANYITTENVAPWIEHQASDAYKDFPVYKSPMGCMLNDTSAIESFTSKDNGDGTVTISLTLKPELDPEPISEGSAHSSSKIGAIFNPISHTKINNELTKIKLIKVNNYNLTYTDCTATLTYSYKDFGFVSLTQVMNVDIGLNVTAFITITGSARVTDTMLIKKL